MASYTVFAAAPTNFDVSQFFQAGAVRTVTTPTSITYTQANGTRIVVAGAAFSFNPGGVPVSGTISTFTLFDATQTIQFATFGGLSYSLLTLHNNWIAVFGAPFIGLLSGNDTLTGSTDADSLAGNDGDDTISAGDGNDYIDPGRGADTIDGGTGSDMLSYSSGNNDPTITKGITVDLTQPSLVDPWGFTDKIAGIENIRATRFADKLIGNDANNSFEGLAGNDSFAGGNGFDSIRYNRDDRYGGLAGVTVNLAKGTATDGFGNTDSFTGIESATGTLKNDTLIGGDVALSGVAYELYGLDGDDTLTAGAWDSYISPGQGNDTVTAGAGFDQVTYSDYTGANGATFNLATGVINDPYGTTDKLVGLFEAARGTANADKFIGNSLNNQFRGLAGNDFYDGSTGIDRVRYDRDASAGGTKGITANLATGKATDGFGNADTYVSIEAVTGTDQVDTITGGNGVLPNFASFEIYALGGNDILAAGTGDLYVEPGAGNDTVTAGSAFDQVSYGDYTGANGATFNLATGVINDPYGGTDKLVGLFEAARGTRNADKFTGNSLNNQFHGLAGNDSIDGGAGLDRVRYDREVSYGGKNGVTVNLATGKATDAFGTLDTLTSIEAVTGTDVADTLTGGDALLSFGATYEIYARGGDDVIQGGAYEIYVQPGAGNDKVTAGTGFAQISYEEYTGANGAVIDLAAGFAADPYGGIDTLSGVTSARGTLNADVFVGNDAENVLRGLGGADTYDGGLGADQVRFDRDARYGGTAGVVVDLGAGVARDGFGNLESLVSIENVRGTNSPSSDTPGFSDLIKGSDVANVLQGLGGSDQLDGAGGLDTADYSIDALEGGTKGIFANLGVAPNTGMAIDGFGNTDILLNIENIRGTNSLQGGGSPFSDVMLGSSGNNVFQGLGGPDYIDGAGGFDTADYSLDTIFGGTSGVTVNLAAGYATDGFGDTDILVSIENAIGTNRPNLLLPGYSDLLIGSTGDNTLDGRGGNDILDGGLGNDILIGGAGIDTMTGGGNSDRFTIDTAALVGGEYDLVTDFTHTADTVHAPLAIQGKVVFAATAGGVALLYDTGAGVYSLNLQTASSVAQVQAAVSYV